MMSLEILKKTVIQNVILKGQVREKDELSTSIFLIKCSWSIVKIKIKLRFKVVNIIKASNL